MTSMTRWMGGLGVSWIVLGSSGCYAARSAGFGQTAIVPLRGMGEAGLTTGLQYRSITATSTSGPSSGPQNASVANAPALEGNLLYAVADGIGINLHGSPAGLQPGVKIGLMQGDLSLALLPSVGFSWGTYSTPASSSSSPIDTSMFFFLVGAQVLLSHSSGFYGGIGYDFDFGSSASRSTFGGMTSTSTQQQTAHNLTAGVGWEFSAGALAIRPEIVFSYTPVGDSSSSYTGAPAPSTTSQSGWLFFPNVTLAIRSGASLP